MLSQKLPIAEWENSFLTKMPHHHEQRITAQLLHVIVAQLVTLPQQYPVTLAVCKQSNIQHKNSTFTFKL